jgi:cellobiose phosphorylase
MKAGYFDDDAREYVITTPKTPVRWINYLGTLEFGGFVDQTGGGVICKGDPALNRITKYIPQLPNADMNGQTCFIRVDNEELFSPFFTPVLRELDRYECRVGLSYSRFTAECAGVRVEVTVFVPRGEQREIRRYRVTNIGGSPRTIDVAPVVEYSHFDALKQFTNADWVPQTMQSRRVDGPTNTTVLAQYAFMKKGAEENFFACTPAASSFETDRARFLGDAGYGSWSKPGALANADLSNTEVLRGDNIAALLVRFGEVGPGETRSLVTQLGQCSDWAREMEDLARFSQDAEVDTALDDLRRFWDRQLSSFQVSSPSAEFDSMVNVHNPRQCYTTLNWSRYLSSYQLGLGARGIGFRDSSQDILGALSAAPGESKELLKRLLSVQCQSGRAKHQFFPRTMEANDGDSREMEDRPDWYGDDHLWIVLAVCEYLKETGDRQFLEELIPFYEKDTDEAPLESGRVIEHLRRSLDFTQEHRGAHGLPLLGFADWNDTVNLPTGAESVFVANLYGVALREFAALCDWAGLPGEAAGARERWESIRAVVADQAWDGEWYLRYFDADGTALGSRANRHGRIFANAQSWSVLSGFADPERRATALESVNRHLNTEKGIKLSAPGYDGFDPKLGGVTTYPPGAKENGGIFLHSNPWVMIAETIAGNGDRAFQYYRQINPAARNDSIERYELEPYCYAQNFLGDEHPQFGLARNSWLSGTASWAYQAATKWILGIRPEYGGLRIDPCIPRSWKSFSVIRRFRDCTYEIRVSNPQEVSTGVKSMSVNGVTVGDTLAPVGDGGSRFSIEVEMGVPPDSRSV